MIEYDINLLYVNDNMCDEIRSLMRWRYTCLARENQPVTGMLSVIISAYVNSYLTLFSAYWYT